MEPRVFAIFSTTEEPSFVLAAWETLETCHRLSRYHCLLYGEQKTFRPGPDKG